MMSDTDVDVLRRFASGDPEAFAAIYRRYRGAVFAVALSLLGRRELAADAVQIAFLQAWRAADSFSAEADLGPWLFTIVRRAAIDIWRRERRHAGGGMIEERAMPPAEPPSLDQQWTAWQVRQALDALPAGERDVVRLAHVTGLTQSEIGQRLGIPVGTVKSRTRRAHARLATVLDHLRPRTGLAQV